MNALGMQTAGDCAVLSGANLNHCHMATALDLARGIDERPVSRMANASQISTGNHLPEDFGLWNRLPAIYAAPAEDLWRQIERKTFEAKGVTLKLKTHDFALLRSLTYSSVLPTVPRCFRRRILYYNAYRRNADAFRLIGIGESFAAVKPAADAGL